MILDPFLLLQFVFFHFLQVVTEFVISNYVTISSFSILNAVRVIIVLRWCLNYVAFGSQIVE